MSLSVAVVYMLFVCLWFWCDPGAWEWEHLQEAVGEKLKNSLAVAQLMDRVRSFLGRDKVTHGLYPIPPFNTIHVALIKSSVLAVH